jgi:hypothetical protein
MAAACPHCRQLTIPMRRKLYAFDAWPASCPQCAGLSYVGLSFRHMLLLLVPEVAGIVLITGWAENPQLGAVGLILLLGVMATYQRLAPLVPIAARRARYSRWLYAIGWVLILGLIALSRLHTPENLL